ncbi:MAG: AraC family transcriptional regulator [Clostridia bacterium]|nr:AraC family transcriptional regulator [Clostridia bacterium]
MIFQEIKPNTFRVGVFDSRGKYKNTTSSTPRKCNQFEIEFFLEEGGSASINNKDYKIHKNHILFTRPGDIRKSKMHFKCFYLHMELKDAEMTEYLKDVSPFFVVSSSKIYYNMFHQLIQLQNKKGYDERLLYATKITELLLNIHNDSCINNESEKISAIQGAERFMNENITNKIGLKDVAESVHLSPNYFHTLFTSMTGCTPHDYLMTKRLNYAKDLIMTSDHDMMTIAMLSGFGSQSYFNYYFKKATGLSPSKYREREFEKYII